ncbi:MAG: hypothetical protein CML03_12660 [Pseudooceanicola sp.]|nr:hypothetical protein [Pseudooceanicola sp.]
MTNDTADLANEEPRPIQDWENLQVKGDGMACKEVYDDHVARVAELRQRQEAYEASLPKEPLEALAEINHTLHDMRDASEPQYAARAALEIIHQLADHGALDDSDQMKDAIYWLSGQGLEALTLIEDGARKAVNIAHQFHPMHKVYRA